MKEGGYAALMFYEPNDMMSLMTFTAVPSIQLPALLKVNYKYKLSHIADNCDNCDNSLPQ